MIVNIEVIHDGVLNLLSDLEHLDLIRLHVPVKSAPRSKGKLSKQFAGALRLSDAGYEAFQNTLREGRNEWTRDIY